MHLTAENLISLWNFDIHIQKFLYLKIKLTKEILLRLYFNKNIKYAYLKKTANVLQNKLISHYFICKLGQS